MVKLAQAMFGAVWERREDVWKRRTGQGVRDKAYLLYLVLFMQLIAEDVY